MDAKRISIIVGAAIVLVLVIGLIYLLSGSEDGRVSPELADHEFESWDQPIPNEEQFNSRAMSIFDENIDLTYDQLMDAARSGKISLVSELWRMRRKCPEGLDRFQCNQMLLQWIRQKFPPPDNERLASLMKNYLLYEESMASFETPDIDNLNERYEAIREQRREFFSPEEAKLVFGLEEAKYDFTEEFDSFRQDTAGMSGDERVAAYEEMRERVYGQYYEEIKNREDSFHAYEVEMFLRNDEMSGMESDEQTTMTRSVRERYFGPERADAMEAVDDLLAREAEAEAKIRQEEADYIANNPDVTGAELDAMLMEIRVKHLGSREAAEAYTRRKQLEAEL